jgi:hypothetical protein
MMIPRVRAIIAVGAFLIAGVSAHAAEKKTQATYEFGCFGNSPINLTLTSFNLPITSSTTPGGTGGGAGKVTYGPLTIQFLANQTYFNLLTAVETGQHYNTCALTEKVLQGTGSDLKTTAVYTWNFTLVNATGVTAIGSDESNSNSGGTDLPTPLVQATFLYSAVSASVN